jgi:hypothetical protein
MCVKTGSYNLHCIILYLLYYIISNIIIHILLNHVLFVVLLLCRLSEPSLRHGAILSCPPQELTVFSGLGICRISPSRTSTWPRPFVQFNCDIQTYYQILFPKSRLFTSPYTLKRLHQNSTECTGRMPRTRRPGGWNIAITW